MIDYDGNILQQQLEQPKRKNTEAEKKAARENEDALYAMGFRPHGCEW